MSLIVSKRKTMYGIALTCVVLLGNMVASYGAVETNPSEGSQETHYSTQKSIQGEVDFGYIDSIEGFGQHTWNVPHTGKYNLLVFSGTGGCSAKGNSVSLSTVYLNKGDTLSTEVTQSGVVLNQQDNPALSLESNRLTGKSNGGNIFNGPAVDEKSKPLHNIINKYEAGGDGAINESQKLIPPTKSKYGIYGYAHANDETIYPGCIVIELEGWRPTADGTSEKPTENPGLAPPTNNPIFSGGLGISSRAGGSYTPSEWKYIASLNPASSTSFTVQEDGTYNILVYSPTMKGCGHSLAVSQLELKKGQVVNTSGSNLAQMVATVGSTTINSGKGINPSSGNLFNIVFSAGSALPSGTAVVNSMINKYSQGSNGSQETKYRTEPQFGWVWGPCSACGLSIEEHYWTEPVHLREYKMDADGNCTPRYTYLDSYDYWLTSRKAPLNCAGLWVNNENEHLHQDGVCRLKYNTVPKTCIATMCCSSATQPIHLLFKQVSEETWQQTGTTQVPYQSPVAPTKNSYGIYGLPNNLDNSSYYGTVIIEKELYASPTVTTQYVPETNSVLLRATGYQNTKALTLKETGEAVLGESATFTVKENKQYTVQGSDK